MSTKMAQRYEKAWHKLYYESSRWIQEQIIEEPDGRHALGLAHEAAILAEKDNKEIIAPTGCNK